MKLRKVIGTNLVKLVDSTNLKIIKEVDAGITLVKEILLSHLRKMLTVIFISPLIRCSVIFGSSIYQRFWQHRKKTCKRIGCR